MKMQIWDYSDNFYLGISDIKIRELPGEHVFQKGVSYIMDFRNTTLRRKVSKLLVIVFLKLINIYYILVYREMGLSESALNPFSFLSHCKVSCCTKICGEDNHCNVNIGTHEYVNSDSEEEHI